MVQIKIISNPYEDENKIKYQKFYEDLNEWKDIDDSSSELLKDEFKLSFFPFKAKEIVDAILIQERENTETIEIVFEGTDDEYKELEAICSEENYKEAIILNKSPMFLANARDILPKVKDIFAQIQEIISASVADDSDSGYEISEQKKKFADVSKEVIPICVLGNYSSGKSTFINALIGCEILPSGEQPLTARIHKIERSSYKDRANIRFEYDNQKIEINFDGNNYSIVGDCDNDLLQELKQEMENTSLEIMEHCINKTLKVINNYKVKDNKDTKDNKISDLIEISIPFNTEGIFGQSQNKFIIFDTPGSNSDSNDGHMEVLKNAMNDLSNGLLLYVSRSDTLDTNDNGKLCDEVNRLDKLDKRFTMIIINQADQAALDEINEESICNQTIPKNIKYSGIYLVSSIMALGSKVNGNLIDTKYRRIFNTIKTVYEDSNSSYYTQLYKYNIMPKQIKIKTIKESDNYEKNRILANSGLYCIEKEIETFAQKYSPYNKCQQSLLFLNAVINLTSEEIEKKKRICKNTKEQLEEKLDEDKQKLLCKLQESSSTLQETYISEYGANMESYLDSVEIPVTKENLLEWQTSFTQNVQMERCYNELQKEIENLQKICFEELKKGVKNFKLSDIRNANDNFKEFFEKLVKLHEMTKEIDKEAADNILTSIKKQFSDSITNAQNLLYEASRKYWVSKSVEMKEKLAEVVTGSSELIEQKRKELVEIIMTYDIICFDKQVDDIFIKTVFKRPFSNTLNLEKLVRTYNSELKEGVSNIYQRMKDSHKSSFEEWNNNLLTKIEGKITEYNPELQVLAISIDDNERQIKKLEDRQEKLIQYQKDIKQEMDWKSTIEA